MRKIHFPTILVPIPSDKHNPNSVQKNSELTHKHSEGTNHQTLLISNSCGFSARSSTYPLLLMARASQAFTDAANLSTHTNSLGTNNRVILSVVSDDFRRTDSLKIDARSYQKKRYGLSRCSRYLPKINVLVSG